MDIFAPKKHSDEPPQPKPQPSLKLTHYLNQNRFEQEGLMRSDNSTQDSGNSKRWSQKDTHSYNFKAAQQRPFMYRGQTFCSRSEAACAALMSKYLRYELIDGETFQVPMGKGPSGVTRQFDYLVFDTVFEFHPFHPPRDPQYWKILHRLGKGHREKFRQLWAHTDGIKYADKRRAQLKEGRIFKDAELIVARSAEDFYDKVIVRFMREKNLAPFRAIPPRDLFLREFREILGEVKELRPKGAGRIRVRNKEERNRRAHG